MYKRQFAHGGREVVAELHSSRGETLRLAVVVARDIDESPEVLRELNQANAGLVGIRLWLDRQRVVAATDLACGHLDDLLDVVDSLTTQVAGLDLFLGALSGVR